MTLFHEPWWLDAVAPGAWEEVSVSENGAVVGRLPFQRWRVLGGSVIGMPALTRTLGPLVRRGTGKPQTERQRDARIVAELLARLPPHLYFKHLLPPGYDNPLPLQFSGFSLSCECVYAVDCRIGTEAVWAAMPTKTRTMIRHSQESYTVRTCDDPEAFHRFHSANLEATGRPNHFSAALVGRIHAACMRHDAGRILALHDRAGAMVAAIVVAWSGARMHFLLQTRAAGSRNGVIEHLMWEAAALASARGLVFDLDGVPNETAARRMAQFGGDVEQRLVVTRGAWLLASLRHMQREARWRLGRRDMFV